MVPDGRPDNLLDLLDDEVDFEAWLNESDAALDAAEEADNEADKGADPASEAGPPALAAEPVAAPVAARVETPAQAPAAAQAELEPSEFDLPPTGFPELQYPLPEAPPEPELTALQVWGAEATQAQRDLSTMDITLDQMLVFDTHALTCEHLQKEARNTVDSQRMRLSNIAEAAEKNYLKTEALLPTTLEEAKEKAAATHCSLLESAGQQLQKAVANHHAPPPALSCTATRGTWSVSFEGRTETRRLCTSTAANYNNLYGHLSLQAP